jgi:hypothetical protein
MGWWQKIKLFFTTWGADKKTEAPVPVVAIEKIAPIKLTPPKPKEEEKRPAPPWYLFALKFKGKREQDPEFNKEMSAKWGLVGLSKYKTISGKTYAWCGLAMAVALAGVGLSHQKDGAGAKNWAKYGVAIDWKTDGIPRGAIIHINSKECGSGSGNHVTQADGDCSPEDLNKPGATINGFGGNQGDTWKVSVYNVKAICAVRWPKEYPKPPPIKKSDRCTSGKAKDESTR